MSDFQHYILRRVVERAKRARRLEVKARNKRQQYLKLRRVKKGA